MTSIIGICDIINKFKDELSVLRKGEQSFEAGNITKVMYDGSLGILRGEVAASMKNTIYKVEVTLDDSKIKEVTCSCPRGQYQCHHIASLLIYANKNISKTDNICKWKKPSTKALDPININKLYPKKDYNATNRNVNNEDRQFFLERLKNLNRFTGFYWILQEEPTVQATSNKENITNTKTMPQILALYKTKEDILLHMKISESDIKTLAEITVGQRHNPLWHELRIGRITASNFGPVIAAINRDRFPPSLFSVLLQKKTLDGVKSIQWGIEHENTAIQLFEEMTKLTVTPTGLWLDPSGILGASPDGLIGDDAIIEVKCPYKHRMSTAEEIQNDKKYCFKAIGQFDTSHQYYHQIQGQLAIVNRKLCYLVIWSTVEAVMVTVERDRSWANNLVSLKTFYENHLLPRLME